MPSDKYFFKFLSSIEIDNMFSLDDSYSNFLSGRYIDIEDYLIDNNYYYELFDKEENNDYDFNLLESLARDILTPENYMIFMLYHYYNLKQRLISEAFNISQSSISQRLKRTRRKLRTEYEKKYIKNKK